MYKPTKNAWLEQALFIATRCAWVISAARGRSADAFFLWPWGCWHSGPHDAASVSCFFPPALSPGWFSCLSPVPCEAPTPDPQRTPPEEDLQGPSCKQCGFLSRGGNATQVMLAAQSFFTIHCTSV